MSDPVEITKATRIPLGMASGVIAGVLTAGLALTAWISSMIWQGSQVWMRLETQVANQGRDIELIRVELQSAVHSRWTAEDQARWIELLRARNPTLSIPDGR